MSLVDLAGMFVFILVSTNSTSLHPPPPKGKVALTARCQCWHLSSEGYVAPFLHS